MSGILLSTGLADLSKELSEAQTNSTTLRIRHYNDAVIDFAKEQKWSFLVKKNTELIVQADKTSYDIPTTLKSDWRTPGAIRSINIGSGENEFLPVSWDDRKRYSGDKFFCVDPEEEQFIFLGDLGNIGDVITIHYYFIPTRIEDLSSTTTFPIPDKHRKIVSTLAASYVQGARYLDAKSNLLYKLYEIAVNKLKLNEAETHNKKPKSLLSYPQFRGFNRRNFNRIRR